jgi:hypothetical protein
LRALYYSIDMILPNGPGRAILFTESALEATDGEMLRDVGPAVIRAQCAANSVQVAQEIVRLCSCSPHEASDPNSTPKPRLEKHAPTLTQPQSGVKATRQSRGQLYEKLSIRDQFLPEKMRPDAVSGQMEVEDLGYYLKRFYSIDGNVLAALGQNTTNRGRHYAGTTEHYY